MHDDSRVLEPFPCSGGAARSLPVPLRLDGGFTLVELMIVIVVLGIVAAIGISNFVQFRQRAMEAGTKTNMHTLQLAAEDYAVQNGGIFSAILDATHIADLLPLNFANTFTGDQGSGVAWEDRATFAAPASTVPGISSYADSGATRYNVKGHGRTKAISLVLVQGD